MWFLSCGDEKLQTFKNKLDCPSCTCIRQKCDIAPHSLKNNIICFSPHAIIHFYCRQLIIITTYYCCYNHWWKLYVFSDPNMPHMRGPQCKQISHHIYFLHHNACTHQLGHSVRLFNWIYYMRLPPITVKFKKTFYLYT